MLSSSVKHFSFPFTRSSLCRQSDFCFVTEAESALRELLLHRMTDAEEQQEVTASLATANRISIDVNSRQYLQNERKT